MHVFPWLSPSWKVGNDYVPSLEPQLMAAWLLHHYISVCRSLSTPSPCHCLEMAVSLPLLPPSLGHILINSKCSLLTFFACSTISYGNRSWYTQLLFYLCLNILKSITMCLQHCCHTLQNNTSLISSIRRHPCILNAPLMSQLGLGIIGVAHLWGYFQLM